MLVPAAPRPLPPTRAPRVALAAALAVALALGGLVIAARGASADSSSSLVTMANSARAAHGLPSLAVSGDLAAAARTQASRMAASHTLAHTPNLGGAVCCWSTLGENVGEGPSASTIEAAFMASPAHRDNILSSGYTQIGVGAVVDASGTLWVSEIFRRPTGAAPAPTAPKPVVTHAASPRPVTPPHRAATAAKQPATQSARQPAMAPNTPPRPPAAVQTRASRDLARISLAAAQRLAKQLDNAPAVRGVDPVTRMLDFVAINATLG